MYIDDLPAEILTQVYLSLPTVSSALALSATCHCMYSTYHSSKRLLILTHAAENEFGPLDDISQLLTHNASQPAHVRRNVPVSDALFQQIIRVGRVAKKWEDIYPFRRWKSNFADRRLLTTVERVVLRRALYRLWLFDRAFHNSSQVRTCRLLPDIVRERAALLHNFGTLELAEMLDVHLIFRDVVANNVCPSNGKLRAKYHKRFQEVSPHHVNIHLNYPTRLPGALYSNSKYHASLQPSHLFDTALDGWGDDVGHYYVVEDMMKLDPEQILYLREQCPSKGMVEAYVAGEGEWFSNNGEVFSETMGFVIRQRGGDMEELKDAVRQGDMGVTMQEDRG